MLKFVAHKTTLSFGIFTRFGRIMSRNMSYISVRKVLGEERIQMTFKITEIGKNGNGRVFNMDRSISEELFKTLSRIQANVSKVNNKKNKKKKSKQSEENSSTASETPELVVTLENASGEVIDGDTANSDTWNEGDILIVGDDRLNVRVNVPLIKELTLPKCIMPGFNIFPNIDAEFVDMSHCEFTWFKESKEWKEESSDEMQATPGISDESSENWVKFGDGPSFMPTNSVINFRLRLQCIPGDGKQVGEPKDVVSKLPVTAGPGFCPFERRHLETQETTDPGSFRVVTYNILANTYADSDFSREYLYPYCPRYALEQDYRKHLLLKEITGYNADIICLQEVDRRLFVNDFLPIMEQSGFDGSLRLKYGQVPEGTAIFFRKAKFSRMLGQHDIPLIETLRSDSRYEDVWKKVCRSEGLKTLIEDRTSALQVTVLESTESKKKVIVGTTHFYFHPKASHVRILQTVVSLRHLDSVAKQYSDQGEESPSIVFCGDFNSTPGNGVHQFISEKYIPSHHADWYTGGREEFAEDMEFTHDLDLVCATGFPTYTNFVTSFSGCLDYIYVDKTKLEPTKVVSMPTHEEVTQFTALPNAVFPSDHIALICDLTWK